MISQAEMKTHGRLQSEDVIAQRGNVWFVCWKLATRFRGFWPIKSANIGWVGAPWKRDPHGVVGPAQPSCMVSLKAIWTYASLIGNESIPKSLGKILDTVERHKGIPAKQNAFASKNLPIFKGDCNGHRPTEIIWPCTTAKEGVIKKKFVLLCLRTADLPKLVKKKCPQKATSRPTCQRTVERLRMMMSKETDSEKNGDISNLLELYSSNVNQHRWTAQYFSTIIPARDPKQCGGVGG